MNIDVYFKHSVMALSHPVLAAFAQREKAKGLGIYWYLRERLCTYYKERCTLETLKQLVVRGIFSYASLKRVITDPTLFHCEDGTYWPVALFDCESTSAPLPVRIVSEQSLARQRRKERKAVAEAPETAVPSEEKLENVEETCVETCAENAENGTKIEENRAKIEEKCAKNEEKCAKIEEKTAEKTVAKTHNSLKTNVKRAVATLFPSRTCVEEKEADNHLLLLREREMPLKRVRCWKEVLKEMPLDSQWIELACMKSGFGQLLKENLPLALDYFARHIELYKKGETLLAEQDLYEYFVNFVTNSRTSRGLRDYLIKQRQTSKSGDACSSPYECRIDGKRSYNGRLIPDAAPPRPSADVVWNDLLNRWEPGA